MRRRSPPPRRSRSPRSGRRRPRRRPEERGATAIVAPLRYLLRRLDWREEGEAWIVAEGAYRRLIRAFTGNCCATLRAQHDTLRGREAGVNPAQSRYGDHRSRARWKSGRRPAVVARPSRERVGTACDPPAEAAPPSIRSEGRSIPGPLGPRPCAGDFHGCRLRFAVATRRVLVALVALIARARRRLRTARRPRPSIAARRDRLRRAAGDGRPAASTLAPRPPSRSP